MISTVIVLLVIGFQSIGAETRNYNVITGPTDNRFIFNAVIRQLFELFRDVVRNGDIEKEIPILDPYKLDYTAFDITRDYLTASGNFTNGVFTGLGDYQLGSFNFHKKPLSIDLELTFPLVSYYSESYEVYGNLFAIFSISGSGVMKIDVHNSIIYGKLYLKQSGDGKSILLSHFENTEFSIENIKSKSQFDSNIDEIANAMVTDLLSEYLSRFSKTICATYETLVVQALNTILDKFDNWKIISVIL